MSGGHVSPLHGLKFNFKTTEYTRTDEMSINNNSGISSVQCARKEIDGLGVAEHTVLLTSPNMLQERSHLYELMHRCLEICDDDEFIEFLSINLGYWAEQSADDIAKQQSEMTFAQLGMIPDSIKQ